MAPARAPDEAGDRSDGGEGELAGILVESRGADGAVRWLRWHRPAKRNAIDLQMYRAMTSALSEAQSDATVDVVVFAGGIDVFTAGNDLGDFVAATGGQGSSGHPEHNGALHTSLAPVIDFLQALQRFDKPLLAAVRGPAIGIGTTMLLHCDIVCASEDARFAMPFTALGLCPEAGASLLLPRLAGYQQAARLLMLGEPFDAGRAAALGLIGEVVRADELDTHVQRLAEALAGLPSEAVRATKALLKRPDESVSDRIDAEIGSFETLLQTASAQQRIGAFVARAKHR